MCRVLDQAFLTLKKTVQKTQGFFRLKLNKPIVALYSPGFHNSFHSQPFAVNMPKLLIFIRRRGAKQKCLVHFDQISFSNKTQHFPQKKTDSKRKFLG